MTIDDRDLRAFSVYAGRELSLDASQRCANKYGRGEEQKKTLGTLRAHNLNILFRETRRLQYGEAEGG